MYDLNQSAKPVLARLVSSARPLAIGLAVISLVLTGLSGPAQTADYTQSFSMPLTDQNLTPEVVTLGLNKSIVVDLPRPAKDVLVSSPAKADAIMRTPYRAYIIGQEIGQTNIFFFDEGGNQIVSLELIIERDLTALRSMMSRLLPDGNILIDTINENIILTGTVNSQAEAGRAADIAARFAGDPEKVMNMVSIIGRDQVMLKVTIAEMERSVSKQFGVNTSSLIDSGSLAFNILTSNPFSISGSALSGTRLLATYTSGATTIDAAIRALEQQGLIKTLAEPTLTAVSGETASFLAGGEFPIPIGTGDDGVTIEYKPFGVGLAFTPVVLSEGRISLRVKAEVSETTTDGAFSLGTGSNSTSVSVPGLKVRRTETTVEMSSGSSLVVAGLIKEETRQSLNGIPGIKDLPVLGGLFRSQEFQNSETELVIIITPYIVNPVHQSQLALPTDGMSQPSDVRAILFGRLNEVYGVGGASPSGAYQGGAGFIIE